MKALVIAIVLGAMLSFAATAQAASVKISLKGVTTPGASRATVLIVAEAQNSHIGGNWTVTQVKVARTYVETHAIGRRYTYLSTVLTKYLKHPTPGSHTGTLAFIGASPATVLIVAEAQNGHIGGNWTAAQIRIARAYEKTNPYHDLYPDVPGLLARYLASPTVGSHTGALDFTGASPVLWALGVVLMGCGLLLRRRCPA